MAGIDEAVAALNAFEAADADGLDRRAERLNAWKNERRQAIERWLKEIDEKADAASRRKRHVHGDAELVELVFGRLPVKDAGTRLAWEPAALKFTLQVDGRVGVVFESFALDEQTRRHVHAPAVEPQIIDANYVAAALVSFLAWALPTAHQGARLPGHPAQPGEDEDDRPRGRYGPGPL